MENYTTTTKEAYQLTSTQSLNVNNSNETTNTKNDKSSDNTKSKPNFIKVQDDIEPLYFDKEGGKFKLHRNTDNQIQDFNTPYWLLNCIDSESDDPDEVLFNKETLRQRIEPWLTALCQSEHLSLLVGSGLTSALQFIAQGEPINAMNPKYDFGYFNKEIKKHAQESVKKYDRGNEINIEDCIHSALDLLNGLNVQCSTLKELQKDPLLKNIDIPNTNIEYYQLKQQLQHSNDPQDKEKAKTLEKLVNIKFQTNNHENELHSKNRGRGWRLTDIEQ